MTSTDEADQADTAELVDRKAALRGSVRTARADLTPDERARASREATDRVLRLPEVWRVGAVLLYAAAPDEVSVDTALDRLLDRGTDVYLPRVDGDVLEVVQIESLDELVEGHKGIREPTGEAASLFEIDTVLVPGVAFDLDGGRLGQGGGHYDRLLAEMDTDTFRIGMCFSCQLVPRVPREPHDQVMDLVVSDLAIHRSNARLGPQDA